jgi:hypothetical protein
MSADIINNFLQRLLELYPQTSAGDALRVEQQLRQQWGGAQVYVCKAAAEGKARRLAVSLAAGVPLAEAMAAAGCSRRTGYRLLTRRWRVR